MPQSQPIGFRLPPSAARALAKEAARHGLTPGTYARRLVLEALTDESGKRLLDEVGAARRDLARLRADLGRVTIALLADAGKADEKQAEEWVRDNLTGV